MHPVLDGFSRLAYRNPFANVFEAGRTQPIGPGSGAAAVAATSAAAAFSEQIALTRAEALATALLEGDPQIYERPRRFAFARPTRLPASERYHYAKNRLTPEERTLLVNVMMGRLRSDATPSTEASRAVDVLEAVWHAQLRIHTPEEREQLRAAYSEALVTGGAFSIAPWLLGLPMVAALQQIRSMRREYSRSEARPEYIVALNGMLDVMSQQNIAPELRHRVASVVIDQHLRAERTLAPEHHNHLVRSISPDGPAEPQRGHLTIRLPPPGSQAEEERLRRALIDVAVSGFRFHLPARPVYLEDFDALPPGPLPDGVDPDAMTCEITQDVMQAQDQPVALYAAPLEQRGSQAPVLVSFQALMTWLNQNNGNYRHPWTQAPLHGNNLRDFAHRIELAHGF